MLFEKEKNPKGAEGKHRKVIKIADERIGENKGQG
jgi:hypothetical protein